MSEKISRFLDGDLSIDETRSLLKELEQQPELKATLVRYTAVRHAMKHNNFLWVSSNLSDNIQQKIRQTSAPVPRYGHRYYWFALAAASIAAVAVSFGNNVVEQVEYSSAMQLTQTTRLEQTNCDKMLQANVTNKYQTQNANKLVKLASYCKQ